MNTNTSSIPGVGPGTDVHVACFDEPAKKWMEATYPPLVAEARARALETSDISLASFGELLFIGRIQGVAVSVTAL